MKNDLIFILIVIALGVAGLFYTNRAGDDLLVEKSKSNAQDGIATEDEEYNIYYESMRGSKNDLGFGESPLDSNRLNGFNDSMFEVDINHIEIDDIQSEDIRDRNEINSDINQDEESRRIKNVNVIDWRYLYDRWQLVLVDSISTNSNLKNVDTLAECSLTFYSTDESETTINNVSRLELKGSKNSLKFITKNIDYELNGLATIVRLKNATDKLISFCVKRKT
jgi:hypothetical protein